MWNRLNECKTLIIIKRHDDRKGKKHPVTSLPGRKSARKETMKVKHRSHKGSFWNYFVQRLPSVPVKWRWQTFHRQWCSTWRLWDIRKRLSYIPHILLKKAAKYFRQASLSGSQGVRMWPSPMENSGCLFKKTEHLLGSHTQAQGGGIFVPSNWLSCP